MILQIVAVVFALTAIVLLAILSVDRNRMQQVDTAIAAATEDQHTNDTAVFVRPTPSPSAGMTVSPSMVLVAEDSAAGVPSLSSGYLPFPVPVEASFVSSARKNLPGKVSSRLL